MFQIKIPQKKQKQKKQISANKNKFRCPYFLLLLFFFKQTRMCQRHENLAEAINILKKNGLHSSIKVVMKEAKLDPMMLARIEQQSLEPDMLNANVYIDISLPPDVTRMFESKNLTTAAAALAKRKTKIKKSKRSKKDVLGGGGGGGGDGAHSCADPDSDSGTSESAVDASVRAPRSLLTKGELEYWAEEGRPFQRDSVALFHRLLASSRMSCCCINHDGSAIAYATHNTGTGGGSNSVHVVRFDTETRQRRETVLRSTANHTDAMHAPDLPILTLRFMPWPHHLTFMLTASMDGTCVIWDIDSGIAMCRYKGHLGAIWDVDICQQGAYFITGAHDRMACVWRTDNPHPLRWLPHPDEVRFVQWHPGYKYVVTYCVDGSVRVWDLHTAKCVRLLQTMTGHRTSTVSAMRLSTDGCLLATGASDGGVIVWTLKDASFVTLVSSAKSEITSLAWAFDSGTLSAACKRGVAFIWSASDWGTCIATLATGPSTPEHLHFAPRGILVGCGRYDPTLGT